MNYYCTTIVCTNVAPFWQHDDIWNLFGQCGIITDVYLESHYSNGGMIAYVTFQASQNAKIACQRLHGYQALNITNCPRMMVELLKSQGQFGDFNSTQQNFNNISLNSTLVNIQSQFQFANKLQFSSIVNNRQAGRGTYSRNQVKQSPSNILSSMLGNNLTRTLSEQELIQSLRKQLVIMQAKLTSKETDNVLLKQDQITKENELKKKLEALSKKTNMQKKLSEESAKQQNQLITKLQDMQNQYANLKKVKDDLQTSLVNSETETAKEKLSQKKFFQIEEDIKTTKNEVEKWRKNSEMLEKNSKELKKEKEITKKLLSLREYDWNKLRQKYSEKKNIIDKLKKQLSILRQQEEICSDSTKETRDLRKELKRRTKWVTEVEKNNQKLKIQLKKSNLRNPAIILQKIKQKTRNIEMPIENNKSTKKKKVELSSNKNQTNDYHNKMSHSNKKKKQIYKKRSKLKNENEKKTRQI